MDSFEVVHDRIELDWGCVSRGAVDAIPEGFNEWTHVRRVEELRVCVRRGCGGETSRRSHRAASPLRRSDVETVGGEVWNGEMQIVGRLTQGLKFTSSVVVREDTGTHMDGCFFLIRSYFIFGSTFAFDLIE